MKLLLSRAVSCLTLSEVQSRMRFYFVWRSNLYLQISLKSRAERNFVLSSNLSEFLRSPEWNAIFVPRSNLPEFLQSPERNTILFREATNSLRKKNAKCNLAPIFCFPPSVVPWLRPKKHLSDLFLPDKYLGYGRRGLDGPKLIPRFS